MSRGNVHSPGLAALLLVSCSLSCGGSDPHVDLPRIDNLLFVTIDTLRADHVGAIGYDRATTPNIERIVRSMPMMR